MAGGLRIAAGIILISVLALSIVIGIPLAFVGAENYTIIGILLGFQIAGNGVVGILLLIDGIKSD